VLLTMLVKQSPGLKCEYVERFMACHFVKSNVIVTFNFIVFLQTHESPAKKQFHNVWHRESNMWYDHLTPT